MIDIVKAWKDDTYRASLSDEDIPANPAGGLDLTDTDLEHIRGASGFINTNALICLQSVLLFCFTINGNCGNAGD